MTEFRVLPVRCGDAGTIRCRRGDYLFDGGIDGCALPDMLARRKIKRLRVAACTSSCRERLGGILDLMEARYPVKEYWLPDDIRELTAAAVGFNNDWQNWAELTNGVKPARPTRGAERGRLNDNESDWWLNGATTLMELALVASGDMCGNDLRLPREFQDITSRLEAILTLLADQHTLQTPMRGTHNTLLTTMTRFLSAGGGKVGLASLCSKLLLGKAQHLPGGSERGLKALVCQLTLTSLAAALLSETADKTIFFKEQGKLTERLISGHPVKILNGKIVKNPSKHSGTVTARELYNLTKKSSGHQGSLVYQYGESACSVLFCGDSRFSFLNRRQTLVLDRPTAAFVPRQGSPSSDRAYPFIKSMAPHEDFWVRGVSASAKKISHYFKDKENSLCLEHCRNFAMQEILLRHDGRSWSRLSGRVCRG